MINNKFTFVSIGLLLLLIICLSCNRSTPYSYQQDDNPLSTREKKVDATQSGETLVNYIRRLPGVVVNRTGNQLVAFIRGANDNGNSDSAAQFYLNDSPVGTDINEVSGLISVDEIDRIKVVSNLSELSRYGMLGANGVISIRSKKN